MSLRLDLGSDKVSLRLDLEGDKVSFWFDLEGDKVSALGFSTLDEAKSLDLEEAKSLES